MLLVEKKDRKKIEELKEMLYSELPIRIDLYPPNLNTMVRLECHSRECPYKDELSKPIFFDENIQRYRCFALESATCNVIDYLNERLRLERMSPEKVKERERARKGLMKKLKP